MQQTCLHVCRAGALCHHPIQMFLSLSIKCLTIKCLSQLNRTARNACLKGAIDFDRHVDIKAGLWQWHEHQHRVEQQLAAGYLWRRNLSKQSLASQGLIITFNGPWSSSPSLALACRCTLQSLNGLSCRLCMFGTGIMLGCDWLLEKQACFYHQLVIVNALLHHC